MGTFVSFLIAYPIFTAVSALVLAYYISHSIFPIIIHLNYTKKLCEKPNSRSSHTQNTPTLGGVGVFVGLSIVIALKGAVLGTKTEIAHLLVLLTALLVLLFVGIKDDILNISFRKKFITQLIAALMVVLLSNMVIDNFYGVMTVQAIPYWFSVLFTVFVFLLVINAYNLIDGIDALAAGYAIIACAFFGVYFMLNQKYVDGLLSFSTIGAVMAFLRFNISKKKKIFMGDTGSMIIGFIMAYQCVSVLKFNQDPSLSYGLKNAPIFILALFSFPLFDTLRVFIIRIKNKKSPFTADRNHIHHRLIDLGFSHIQTSLILITYTILIVGCCFIFQNLGVNTSLVVLTITVIILMLVPFAIRVKEGKRKVVLPFF